MLPFASMFILLGTIYLVVLTVQDYKDMTVDSKYNYILLGVAISMITHLNVSFWYLLSIAAAWGFLNFYGKKIKFFGKGDFSAFNWLFIGLALINPFILAFYIISIVILGVLYYFFRKKLSMYGIKRIKNKWSIVKNSYPRNIPVPFYPVILGAWIITLPLLIF